MLSKLLMVQKYALHLVQAVQIRAHLTLQAARVDCLDSQPVVINLWPSIVWCRASMTRIVQLMLVYPVMRLTVV